MEERDGEKENRQNGVKNTNLKHTYQTNQFIDIGAFKVKYEPNKRNRHDMAKGFIIAHA